MKNGKGLRNYYATASFAQQVTEKALNGFLYPGGYRAFITHSVVELLEESAKLKKLLDLRKGA